MKLTLHIAYIASLLSLTPVCLGWGVVGHEVVATIAQIHLHDSTREALKLILPAEANGHLAPIAAWADRIKFLPQYRFASELHYTSPLKDYPPKLCHFGDTGFVTDHDVLHAISNYTTRLLNDPKDWEALRFLVHFIGDVHQPLHLTNRERGGNGDPVIFQGRRMSLHALWDTGLITRSVREQTNYTRPLPSRQIEDNLRGTIYDPYIRLILWEGVRNWWRDSLPTWFECPSPLSPESISSSSQQLFYAKSDFGQSILQGGSPEFNICPETWATETHRVTCGYVFPENYDQTAPPKEVNTKEYYGPIRDGNLVEKLLLQGGLRLAATLNGIFAKPEELLQHGHVKHFMSSLGSSVETGI